ncbi:MAG: hypothetical protein ACP5UO_05725 [Thermoplasmata archaeon]
MLSRNRYLSIDHVTVREPSLLDGRLTLSYEVDGEEIQLLARYDLPVSASVQDLRMIALAPLVNYSLFVCEIRADFGITKQDYDFLKKMMIINSREIYVNKMIKRSEFFKEEYIPRSPSHEEASYSPEIKVDIEDSTRDRVEWGDSVAILSSGGKDSLLTYGLMKEAGANVFPIFVNESGGHWRTAVTAYNYFRENERNTLKVWTTVDRFYRTMNSKVSALNDRALKMWSDTYPIQLFIFPVYVFLSLPYILKFGISGVLKGDEFDDPRSFVPESGIRHYNGIYDQTQHFDVDATNYFRSIGYDLKFYSVLRGITGLVEERILFQRYPHLARLQRSCHSCHMEGGEVVPCGKCSKCNGILLFLLANSLDPRIIKYKDSDVRDFREHYDQRLLRLDEDEKRHSLYLISKGMSGAIREHVEKLHEDPEWCDPGLIDGKWREKVLAIISEYTKGRTHLENGEWV